MTRCVCLAVAIILQLLFCIAGSASAVDESENDCRPIPGLDPLLEPGIVLLLGEQHGTAQSPAFLLDCACHAARTGLPLTVGLELAPAEQVTVDRYLESAGAPIDRTALIAGEIWQRDYQDGRNSTAMAEIIEGLRVLRQQGFVVKVSLFDAAYDPQREARMAGNLVATARGNPAGVTLVLTGNLHSRVTPGAGSPPMGYLIASSIEAERVVSLDLAHRGGSSWLCYATANGQECGKVGLKGRGPAEPAGITLLDTVSATGHHGWYQVGEITASPPAKEGFSAGSEAAGPNEKLAFWDQQRKGANGGGGSDPGKWLRAAAEVGIEYVRLSPANWRGEGRDFLLGDADRFAGIPDSDLRKLIDVLDIAERNGIKIVLTMFSLPGARWRQHTDNQFDYRLWNEEEFQAHAMTFWKELAGHLRHHPAVVGYNPLNEPHPARQAGFEDDVGEGFTRWLSENRGGPADLNRFNARTVEAIRSVDPETPILLEGWLHASATGLGHLEPVDDPAVLYGFHFYDPWIFTTYRINKGRFKFPERMPASDSEELVVWTPNDFVDRLQSVVEWSKHFGIPASRVIAAEFGCDRRVTGARGYLAELIAQLNAHKWHWAFYSFRASDWDGLDYELGTRKLDWEYWQERDKGVDHESLIERHDNPLWEVLKREFTETRSFPPD